MVLDRSWGGIGQLSDSIIYRVLAVYEFNICTFQLTDKRQQIQNVCLLGLGQDVGITQPSD